MTVDTDFSSYGCANTFSETFVGLAKVTLFFGLFTCAMKALESYLGTQSNGTYEALDTSDDYEIPVERTYTQIHAKETQTSSQTDIVAFATEQVLEAAVEKEEEEKQIPEFVIGAEDIVDHFNRMIG